MLTSPAPANGPPQRVHHIDEPLLDGGLIENIDSTSGLKEGVESLSNGCDSDGLVVTGKVFDTLQEAYGFYSEYASSKGFRVRVHYANRRRKTNEIYRRQYVCSKEGFKDMNDKRRRGAIHRRKDQRTGCKAMIQVTLSKDNKWVVDKFSDAHNHPLSCALSKVIKNRSECACKSSVSTPDNGGLRPGQITCMGDASSKEKEDEDTSETEVSPSMLWSTQLMFNKAIEHASDSPSEVKKLKAFLECFLEQQATRKQGAGNQSQTDVRE